jgi:lipoprotein-releasing system permease protein
MLQYKLGMDPRETIDGGLTKSRAHQLLIALPPGVELNEGRDRVAEAWRRFCATLDPSQLTDADATPLRLAEVYTWEDLQRPFINAVEKEKVLVTILFSLMCVVAIFLVGCISYMIVEKKTRDIGILKSLGASSRGVAAIFLLYAGAVGVIGCLLGTILGTLFVWRINEIQDFLASLNPQLRVWSPDVYSFDAIPNVVKPADALWVGAFAVIASMVGSLIPSIIAGRVWPVRALRYE